MTEEPIFIQRNISHYGAMLKLHMCDENRAIIEHLLAGAEQNLAAATKETGSLTESDRGHHRLSHQSSRDWGFYVVGSPQECRKHLNGMVRGRPTLRYLGSALV